MKGTKGEIIAENLPVGEARSPGPHVSPGIRLCRRCGIRKVIDRGFYREREGARRLPPGL